MKGRYEDLKILCLTLAAIFATSAVAASAIEFKLESSPTVLTGEQKAGTNDVYTNMGGTATCENITYVGSVRGTSSPEAEVEPIYSGCTAFGFANVSIDVNGCKFRFTASGTMHMVCPSGKAIEWTAPGCTITYGSQTPTSGSITYTNLGTGTTRELGVDVALTGIHYVEENKGLFPSCSSPGVTTTEGTFKGQSVFKGENESGVQHGIWVE